jgi:hypothetical protein
LLGLTDLLAGVPDAVDGRPVFALVLGVGGGVSSIDITRPPSS